MLHVYKTEDKLSEKVSLLASAWKHNCWMFCFLGSMGRVLNY